MKSSQAVQFGVVSFRPPTLEVGGSIPLSTSPRKVRKGLCLCNLLRSTQPNDRETVIEG